MFEVNAEPIGNVNPLPAIDLNTRYVPDPVMPETSYEICARLQRESDGRRIWEFVKQAAEGSNVADPIANAERP